MLYLLNGLMKLVLFVKYYCLGNKRILCMLKCFLKYEMRCMLGIIIVVVGFCYCLIF